MVYVLHCHRGIESLWGNSAIIGSSISCGIWSKTGPTLCIGHQPQWGTNVGVCVTMGGSLVWVNWVASVPCRLMVFEAIKVLDTHVVFSKIKSDTNTAPCREIRDRHDYMHKRSWDVLVLWRWDKLWHTAAGIVPKLGCTGTSRASWASWAAGPLN